MAYTELLSGSYERGPITRWDWTAIDVTRLWVNQREELLPFDAWLDVKTTNYNYDLQSWQIVLVLESVRSTHANRKGTIEFKLDLKDICWDLPYTRFGVVEKQYLTAPLLATHILPHEYMLMTKPWNDYCGGSTYSLEYMFGPMEQYLYGGRDTKDITVDLMKYYVDHHSPSDPNL